MAIDIGRIAYEEYAATFKGAPTQLKWEQLTKMEHIAWRAAAVAVLQHIDEEREELA